MVQRLERIAMMRRLWRREQHFGPQQQKLPEKGGKKRRNLLHTVKTVQKRALNTRTNPAPMNKEQRSGVAMNPHLMFRLDKNVRQL